MRTRRFWIAACLLACLAPSARAQELTPVGEWVGQVSWNDPPVSYSWAIEADGTFSSGRFGRGHSGGGVWNTNGDHVTLKYEDGFRYEGVFNAEAIGGSAYEADGRRFGDFSMWRAPKDYGYEDAGDPY